MKKIFKLAAVSALIAFLASPPPVFADGIDPTALQDYSKSIIGIINNAFVPALMAVALIVFLWGVYKYFILGADNESEKAEGRTFAMWGIIGFVIILSVWGLVAVVRNTFGLTTGNAPTPPTFNTSSGVEDLRLP